MTLVSSDAFLFADDTKILRQVISREDSLILQADIDALSDWSKKWLLKFNNDKCHVLTMGKLDNITHTHRYTLNEGELEHVFEEKDLGVIIDMELKYEEHIATKVRKANAIVGLIRRSFDFLDCDLFRRLYTTFVRPHLEYAQEVWSPHLSKYIKLIENVQIRATKLVNDLSSLQYPERLKKLELPTLKYRRMRGDMIQVYKHFHTYDRSILSHSFQPQYRSSRKHNFQLVWQMAKDGTRGVQANSFYFRTTKTWNNLPREVVNASNINTFKNLLDKTWANSPIKYDHLQEL